MAVSDTTLTAPAADYFTQRIVEALRITAQLNVQPAKDAAGNPVEHTRFARTDKGDIQINYFDLNANPFQFHGTKEGQRWSKPYYRTRLQVPRTREDGTTQKYNAPAGAGNFPYFTPQIIAAYQAQQQIPLLILTEGEFKATAGCMAGLHVVGLPGIQGFYENDGSKKMHWAIIDLLRVCRVQKLLLLTDADTITLNYKPDKDLSTRANSFYAAVKNFREAAMYHIEFDSLQLSDVYFGHIAAKHMPEKKGLDDLLQAFHFSPETITNAIAKLSFDGNEHFYIQNISDGLNKIKEHFGLIGPDNFYQVYQEYIQDREFKFKKITYCWHNEDEKLHRLSHEDVKKFLRIGCDWFKLVEVPNRQGETNEEIKKWKPTEITRDYNKVAPTFLDDIPKYDAWCNIPAMGQKYSRVVNGCYNLFHPIKHQPAAGAFPNIAFFLKHLFSGKGSLQFAPDGTCTESGIIGDPFTVALDYLTLMYRHPMQILPVLCLVSPENNTGKTTFLKWLRDIYGSNATIIDNERFKSNFNSHYISKFIIGIDEGFLDVDKKTEKERLKKLATDDRQYLEFKGADTQEIDFYGKIIICSNDADNLMKIEEGEIRWFVVRVKPFTTENSKLREQMRAEIPAFLHYLSQRQIVHPEQGRAWFAPEHIKTEQLNIIIEKTRNRVDRIVDEFVVETFRTYEIESFKIDLKGLAELINKNGYSKYKIDTLDLKNYLKDKRGMEPCSPGAIHMPTGIDENAPDERHRVLVDKSRVARCYHFVIEDWLKPDQIPARLKPGSNTTEPITNEEDNVPF